MLTKVSKVGTSVGVIIPRYIAVEGGFSQGTSIDIEFKGNKIIIARAEKLRAGWAEAFACYAAEGEDEAYLPDVFDSEALELM